MAIISALDKAVLERFFGMNSGNVLGFSNDGFKSFIFDVTNRNIEDSLLYGGGSKSNKLRMFWSKESNQLVGRLIRDLVVFQKEFKRYSGMSMVQWRDAELCLEIANKLDPVENESSSNLTELQSIEENIDLNKLYDSVKENLVNGKPEMAIDHLHTLSIKFLKGQCKLKNISYDESETISGLFGKISKYHKDKDLFESSMTKVLFKNAGKYFSEFNDVRNNHSFAHDNLILERHEAELICNVIISLLKYLQKNEIS